jgi:ankyrin repeat protein
MSDLYKAAARGKLDEVRRQIALRANINWTDEQGRTPLFVAAREGHGTVVEILVQHGATVDQAKLDTGSTPLFVAAQNGFGDIVEFLLQHGANKEQTLTTDGATPLMTAAEKGHDTIVEALLQHGAKVDQAATNDGATPLFVAAQEGRSTVVEVLLKYGANVDKTLTIDGTSPLLIASYFGHINVVDLLLSKGAGLHDTANDESTCYSLARSSSFTRKYGLLYHLRKWPTTMAILVLKELSLYYLIDSSSLIDLHHYIGTEEFTVDKEEDYIHIITSRNRFDVLEDDV